MFVFLRPSFTCQEEGLEAGDRPGILSRRGVYRGLELREPVQGLSAGVCGDHGAAGGFYGRPLQSGGSSGRR